MSFIFGGDTNFTYDQIQQKRKIADAMMQGPTPRNVGQGIESFTGDIAGALLGRRLDKRDSQLSGEADEMFSSLFGGGMSTTPAYGGGGTSAAIGGAAGDKVAPQGQPDMPTGESLSYGSDVPSTGNALRDGIFETAQSLGMDPMELATIISYETGGTFDPTKAGPTTQWGQHRGLIQFGEPQAKQYGADFSSPETALQSQLGANGAIANYYRQNGWKPGMGMLDAYSIVNAGAPGRYNASDANNGGAPGSVADKVNTQMAGHQQNAQRLIGGQMQPSVSAMNSQPQGMGNIRQIAEALGNPYIQRDPGKVAVLQAMMQQQMAASQPMSRMDQIGLQRAELELAQMQNPQPDIPDSVQALELRAQRAGLAPGTPEYQSFMLSGGDSGPLVDMSGMSVGGQGEVGTIPPGYELYTDPATGARSMRLIEGSPQALEQQQEAESRDRQETLTGRQLNPTIDDIVTARDLAKTGIGRTGMMSGIIGAIPGAGQGAVDLRETIDAIGAGISLENLNQMRQASPTGGALGNVSDKQSALLSSSFGSLNQSQSKPLFLYNLARVENTLNDIVHGEGNGPERHDMTALRRNLRGEDAAQVSEEPRRGQIAPPEVSGQSDTPPEAFSTNPTFQSQAEQMNMTVDQLWSAMSDDQKAQITRMLQ